MFSFWRIQKLQLHIQQIHSTKPQTNTHRVLESRLSEGFDFALFFFFTKGKFNIFIFTFFFLLFYIVLDISPLQLPLYAFFIFFFFEYKYLKYLYEICACLKLLNITFWHTKNMKISFCRSHSRARNYCYVMMTVTE